MNAPEIKLGKLYHFQWAETEDEVVAHCTSRPAWEGFWLSILASTASHRLGHSVRPEWEWVNQFKEITVMDLPLYIHWPHIPKLEELLKEKQ